MAEEQKHVDAAAAALEGKQEAPAAAVENVTEDAPAAAEAAVAEDKPAEEVKPEAAAAEEPSKTEDKKEEETKPVEEGHLGHKSQGMSFPKNLIASKEFFSFGNDAVEPKSLSAYQKAEKSTEASQHNVAWASHTGKGLLFLGDKKTPSHIINLADATEPEVEGANKFHFTSKGSKHTFKAASAAERDNWVSQLKAKITEAKDLVSSVTESETYKKTMESFKPAAKEEKAAEAPKEEAAKADEAKPEDAPKDDAAAPKDEAKEEPKTEEPKRRSASRKRASFFGFGKKDLIASKDGSKTDEAPKAEQTAATEETPAAATEAAPEAEAAKAEEAPAAATENKPVEETPATETEAPKERPAGNKRNSIFGNVFSKKEKKTAEAKPAEATEAPKDGEAAGTEAAPVIPPVEATTPLAVDVNNTATEGEAAATNGEVKKDVKEKRKSSLPFAFGKREKSPAPAEGEEKAAGKSAFSKFRSTIKGKGAAKAEKPAEETAAKEEPLKEETEAAKETATGTEEAAKDESAPVAEAVKEAENKPENVVSAAPAVTAAA